MEPCLAYSKHSIPTGIVIVIIIALLFLSLKGKTETRQAHSLPSVESGKLRLRKTKSPAQRPTAAPKPEPPRAARDPGHGDLSNA